MLGKIDIRMDLRYTAGYKTALLHVMQWFERYDSFLRINKLRTHKGYKLILKKMYENVYRFMEEGDALEFIIPKEEIVKVGGLSQQKIKEMYQLYWLAKEGRERVNIIETGEEHKAQ